MSHKNFIVLVTLIASSFVYIQADENTYNTGKRDLYIITDFTEFNDQSRTVQAETRSFFCALADAAYPFLVTKRVVSTAFRKLNDLQAPYGNAQISTQQQLSDYIFKHFVVKDADVYFLLIPYQDDLFKRNLEEYAPQKPTTQTELAVGLRVNHLPTMSNQSALLMYLLAPESRVLESIKKIFTIDSGSQKTPWNIFLDGHGQTSISGKETMIASFSSKDFALLLQFFKQKLSVGLVGIESCYTLGHQEELFAYVPLGSGGWETSERKVETYPFTIVAISFGDTYFYPRTKVVSAFPGQCDFSKKKLFERLRSKSLEDAFEVNESATQAQLYQVRYKNTELFMPLTAKNNSSVFIISQLLAHAKDKPITISGKARIIVVVPQEVQAPVIFTGSFDPFIVPYFVPLVRGNINVTFQKIAFESTKANQLEFLCALFIQRYHLDKIHTYTIKKVTFSTPVSIKDFKEVYTFTDMTVTIKGPAGGPAALDEDSRNTIAMHYTAHNNKGESCVVTGIFSYVVHSTRAPYRAEYPEKQINWMVEKLQK